MPRQHISSRSPARQRHIPCSSRGRSPDTPARARQSPQKAEWKGLLLRQIPAYSRSARKRQDRPVTPEVAGSSPVAPAPHTPLLHQSAARLEVSFNRHVHPYGRRRGDARHDPDRLVGTRLDVEHVVEHDRPRRSRLETLLGHDLGEQSTIAPAVVLAPFSFEDHVAELGGWKRERVVFSRAVAHRQSPADLAAGAKWSGTRVEGDGERPVALHARDGTAVIAARTPLRVYPAGVRFGGLMAIELGPSPGSAPLGRLTSPVLVGRERELAPLLQAAVNVPAVAVVSRTRASAGERHHYVPV
jgi:hypothetical protein